jgi:type IV conjugative transfer system protein TraL
MEIKIEQRLQDPKRVLMFSADEAAIAGFPLAMGLMGRQVILGAVIAFVLWSAWKRLKGDGGVNELLAAAYWYLPKFIGGFSGFPDSSVSEWRA